MIATRFSSDSIAYRIFDTDPPDMTHAGGHRDVPSGPPATKVTRPRPSLASLRRRPEGGYNAIGATTRFVGPTFLRRRRARNGGVPGPIVVLSGSTEVPRPSSPPTPTSLLVALKSPGGTPRSRSQRPGGPWARIEWFWHAGRVGQSGLELPHLRSLTGRADARVIGSPDPGGRLRDDLAGTGPAAA